jgi:hypothetical protein
MPKITKVKKDEFKSNGNFKYTPELMESWKLEFELQGKYKRPSEFLIHEKGIDPRKFNSGSFRNRFAGWVIDRETKHKYREVEKVREKAKDKLKIAVATAEENLTLNINDIIETKLKTISLFANVMNDINKDYKDKVINYKDVLYMSKSIVLVDEQINKSIETLKSIGMNKDGTVKINEAGGSGGMSSIGGSEGQTNQTSNQLEISIVQPFKSKDK